MFKENEIAILSEKAKSGLPYRTGERVVIVERLYGSHLYDYLIEFDDGTRTKVKESELNKLTNLDKGYLDYIFTGAELEYYPTHEMVKIIKCDYINQTAEVKFEDGSQRVVSFKNLSSIVSK